jgi:hypothetical protein
LEACFVVHDHNGQALAMSITRRSRAGESAAKLLSREEVRRIASKFQSEFS